ncbi:MAG: hypothetical protein ACQEP5_02285 [Actinomycetota bacterium]
MPGANGKEGDLRDAELVFFNIMSRCRGRNASLADTEEIRLMPVETKD